VQKHAIDLASEPGSTNDGVAPTPLGAPLDHNAPAHDGKGPANGAALRHRKRD
jgi:hypothetical protein